MKIDALEPRVLLSADLTPISGSIDVPGETDQFIFTLSQAKRIYFDSLANRADIRWSLAGPSGTIVNDRKLNESDANGLTSSGVLDLGVGEYRLSIDGAADATGAYAFRLLDLANAVAITPGERIDGTIADLKLGETARETDLYRFDAVAGERFFFNVNSSGDSTPSWRLIGPDGTQVFGPNNMADVDVRTLDKTGTYTLAVEGKADGGATRYSFNVVPVIDHTLSLIHI